MIILGIDPGTSRIGYGLIEKDKSNLRFIKCGVIETSSRKEFADLIFENSAKLDKIIKKYRPDIAVIERIFFSKNVKTGIAVAQQRGAIILELSKKGLPIKEYSPSEIKLSVAGYGLADKKSVSKMVRLILNIKEEIKEYDDAFDALAAAITAANRKY